SCLTTVRHPSISTLVPYTTLFRSNRTRRPHHFLYLLARCVKASVRYNADGEFNQSPDNRRMGALPETMREQILGASFLLKGKTEDRKSTRLNSSHVAISYAVFCLK